VNYVFYKSTMINEIHDFSPHMCAYFILPLSLVFFFTNTNDIDMSKRTLRGIFFLGDGPVSAFLEAECGGSALMRGRECHRHIGNNPSWLPSLTS
jgi:hypothetical protein